jgi:hypothetical protein
MPGSLADPALDALYASVCLEDVEALYQGLMPVGVPVMPAREAPEGIRPSPLGSLVWRPALRSRHGVYWLSCRSWREATRAVDLGLLKGAKQCREPTTIAAIAAEVVEVVTGTLGPLPGWSVTAVAPGHSRVSDNFAVLLGHQVAAGLGLPYQQCFADRFMPGSSHPRTNADLPPLEWVAKPTGPVLLVDDLATSGFHVEEAAGVLRSCGVTTVALTWLSGTVGG